MILAEGTCEWFLLYATIWFSLMKQLSDSYGLSLTFLVIQSPVIFQKAETTSPGRCRFLCVRFRSPCCDLPKSIPTITSAAATASGERTKAAINAHLLDVYQAVKLVTKLSRNALAAGVSLLFSDIYPQLALCGSLNQ